MATITVEGVPPGLLLRLAAAAAANGRCLNSEVIVHLARSANAAVGPPGRLGRASPGRCGGGRCGRCGRTNVGEEPAGWGGPSARMPEGCRLA